MKLKLSKYNGSERTLKIKFDGDDFISFDSTMSLILAKCLSEYKHYEHNEDMKDKIDQMVEGFDIISSKEWPIVDEEKRKKVDIALDLFRDNLTSLWI